MKGMTPGLEELDEIKYAREEVEKCIQKQRQKRLDREYRST